MKAFKVFNSDWTCRGFKYEVGKDYTHEGEIIMCEAGFHACKKAIDCFEYYPFDPQNKVAEVELLGKVKGIEEDKQVTDHLKIVRELSWIQVLEIVNTGKNNTGFGNSGDENSGNWNSGNKNSGDENSGKWNSGHWNSGHWNSGKWNSCNKESGFFNSGQPETIRVFNKQCDVQTWKNATKPDFLFFKLAKINEDDKPITLPYKQAFKESYNSLSEEEKTEQTKQLKALPNFDADVFYEISGIRVAKG